MNLELHIDYNNKITFLERVRTYLVDLVWKRDCFSWYRHNNIGAHFLYDVELVVIVNDTLPCVYRPMVP